VATPGRLLDHLGERKARLDLTSFVVLDEADQMLDLGFIPAIRKLLRLVGKERQTLMFSATMVPAIRQLADDFLSNPETVAVTPPSKPVERIDQKVLYTEAADKPEALIDLMAPEAGKRTIIFTRTKHGADRVAKRLVKYGHKANAIHGDKSQNQRTRALDAFKSGESPVLVATDIAARGIDVDGVDLVVNYELPNVAENYVHRIGRTARAGATGRAVALCAPDERVMLKDIEKTMGVAIAGLNDAPPMPKGEAAKSKADAGADAAVRARDRARAPRPARSVVELPASRARAPKAHAAANPSVIDGAAGAVSAVARAPQPPNKAHNEIHKRARFIKTAPVLHSGGGLPHGYRLHPPALTF
jgi:ATP-dependent RNA helicase RhlE